MTRKLNTIFPVHIIAILLAFPVAYQNLREYWQGLSVVEWVIKVLAEVFMLSSFIPKIGYWLTINGPDWYLSLYVLGIFIAPCCVALVKKINYHHKRNIILALVILFGMEISVGLLGKKIFADSGDLFNMIWFTYRFPLMRMTEFIAGCFVGSLYAASKAVKNHNKAIWSIGEALLICICVYLIDGYLNIEWIANLQWAKRSVIFFIPNILLLYFTVNENGWVSRLLSRNVLSKWGKYIIYAFLIHHILIDYLYLVINDPRTVVILTFVLSLGISVLIDRVIIRFKERRNVV